MAAPAPARFESTPGPQMLAAVLETAGAGTDPEATRVADLIDTKCSRFRVTAVTNGAVDVVCISSHVPTELANASEAELPRSFWLVREGTTVMIGGSRSQFQNEDAALPADAVKGTAMLKTSGFMRTEVRTPLGCRVVLSKNSANPNSEFVASAAEVELPPEATEHMRATHLYLVSERFDKDMDCSHGNKYTDSGHVVTMGGRPMVFVDGKQVSGRTERGVATFLEFGELAELGRRFGFPVTPGIVLKTPGACRAFTDAVDRDTFTHAEFKRIGEELLELLGPAAVEPLGDIDHVIKLLGNRAEGLVVVYETESGEQFVHKFKTFLYTMITMVLRRAIREGWTVRQMLDAIPPFTARWCATATGTARAKTTLLSAFFDYLDGAVPEPGVGLWISLVDDIEAHPLPSVDEVDARIREWSSKLYFQSGSIAIVLPLPKGANGPDPEVLHEIEHRLMAAGLRMFYKSKDKGLKRSLPKYTTVGVEVHHNPKATKGTVYALAPDPAAEYAPWMLPAVGKLSTFPTVAALVDALLAGPGLEVYDPDTVPEVVTRLRKTVDAQIPTILADILAAAADGRLVIVLLQALPAVGKTYAITKLAAECGAHGLSTGQTSADDAAETPFNPNNLPSYHRQCQLWAFALAKSGEVNVLFIDNTNLVPSDLRPYTMMAAHLGAAVVTAALAPEFWSGPNLGALQYQNQRRWKKVPEQTIANMGRYTAENIAAAGSLEAWSADTWGTVKSGYQLSRTVRHPIWVDPAWNEKPEGEVTADEVRACIMRGGIRYCTLAAPGEVEKPPKACKFAAGPTTVGVGKHVDPATGHYVSFLVLDWPEGAAWRAERGLPPRDFHVTLAFDDDDFHNVPKDRSTLVPQ